MKVNSIEHHSNYSGPSFTCFAMFIAIFELSFVKVMNYCCFANHLHLLIVIPPIFDEFTIIFTILANLQHQKFEMGKSMLNQMPIYLCFTMQS